MKRFIRVACAAIASAVYLSVSVLAQQPAPPYQQPKLVLGIVVDQFRYDYLTRFRKDYNGGLARLLRDGAVFVDAHHEHFPSVTAIGHTAFMTGSIPSITGIVGNEWYDREAKKQITSVSDDSVPLLGGLPDKKGSSPHNLLVSTLGDEIKMSGKGESKTIGISLKDRAAILPVGRMADGAYWFDPASGSFVSSGYYFAKLPEWVEQFNKAKAADKYLSSKWLPFDATANYNGKPYNVMLPQAGPNFYNALERTPYGNELVEMFAEAALQNEKMGLHANTDVLAVSFSANDYVGHGLGPDAPEVRDMAIRTDRVLQKLLEAVDKQVGLKNVIVVMTADHGVAPLPEVMAKRNMPGGRMSERTVLGKVQEALVAKYGEGNYIVGKSGPSPYFDYDLLKQKNLNVADVENTAAEAVRALPNIFRVYTREQLLTGKVLDDHIDQLLRRGFHIQRAADLFIVARPYWLFEDRGTSHGTPFNYDTHVPVIFMGPGVLQGTYYDRIAVQDIAPTLSALLQVQMPSGSVGRILSEMLSHNARGANANH